MRWAGREAAAEALLETALAGEDWAGAVRFFISAGEANDVVLALAQALTGRPALATRERAYHGGVGLARELTVQPQWHGGLAYRDRTLAPPRLADVRELPAPAAPGSTATRRTRRGPRRCRVDRRRRRAGRGRGGADRLQPGRHLPPARLPGPARRAGARGRARCGSPTRRSPASAGSGAGFSSRPAESRPGHGHDGQGPRRGRRAGRRRGALARALERIEEAGWQSYSSYRAHPIEVAAIEAHIRVSDARRDLAAGARLRRAARARDAQAGRRASRRRAHRRPRPALDDRVPRPELARLGGPRSRSARLPDRGSRTLEAGVMVATSGEQTSMFIAPPLIVDGG